MIEKVKVIIPMSIILMAVDFLYLKSISCYFKKQIFNVQNSSMKIDYTAAILCYFLLCVGLYYFIISKKRPVIEAFLLGLIIYGVYETTNKAILTKWKWTTVLLDGIWGGILYAITTFLTYRLILKI